MSERFPELFEGLSADEVNTIDQAAAINVLSGWVPDRDTIALVTAEARGEITAEEYLARVIEKARTSPPGEATSQPPSDRFRPAWHQHETN